MKKLMMVLCTGILLFCFLYQGSIAFFHKETSVKAKISAQDLGIQLNVHSDEKNAEQKENGYRFEAAMPGAQLDHHVWVENTKAHTVYVRVTVTKYWEDAQGNKLPDADASFISFLPQDPQNWIVIDDAQHSNHELLYYYYRLPMETGKQSSEFIQTIQISPQLSDQTYAQRSIHVTYEAEAIQAIDGEAAALSEWGIEVHLDKDGTLQSVSD